MAYPGGALQAIMARQMAMRRGPQPAFQPGISPSYRQFMQDYMLQNAPGQNIPDSFGTHYAGPMSTNYSRFMSRYAPEQRAGIYEQYNQPRAAFPGYAFGMHGRGMGFHRAFPWRQPTAYQQYAEQFGNYGQLSPHMRVARGIGRGLKSLLHRGGSGPKASPTSGFRSLVSTKSPDYQEQPLLTGSRTGPVKTAQRGAFEGVLR